MRYFCISFGNWQLVVNKPEKPSHLLGQGKVVGTKIKAETNFVIKLTSFSTKKTFNLQELLYHNSGKSDEFSIIWVHFKP